MKRGRKLARANHKMRGSRQRIRNNPFWANALDNGEAPTLRASSMGVASKKDSQRPRELRRRVILPARLRTGVDWSDTCILNISSRGLLIQSARPALPGSLVELRRGEHVILARVMWRDGSRLGLRSDDCVPVEEIMSVGAAECLRLVASEGSLIERRRAPRLDPHQARSQGRAVEFAATIVAAIIFAGGTWAMAHQALARPLATVQAALG